MLDQDISSKIDAIDLTNAKLRLQDPKLGEGWSAHKCEVIERKYKNFLKLIATGMRCTPTIDIDKMWHTHLLDTRNYTKDMEHCFGRYIHHDPYLKPDVLSDTWRKTIVAYEQMFGEPYSTKK